MNEAKPSATGNNFVKIQTSIYDTQKTAVPKENDGGKQLIPKISKLSFKTIGLRIKILVLLIGLIILTCIGLFALSIKKPNTTQPIVEPTTVTNDKTVQSESKISDLGKKVEQFKKDIDTSIVTKKLTPPKLDLEVSF